jgi:hypothetical protein
MRFLILLLLRNVLFPSSTLTTGIPMMATNTITTINFTQKLDMLVFALDEDSKNAETISPY